MNLSKNLQSGASITEFILVAPLILFIGLTGIQYGLIYAARLNVTYAAYEAARAGAIYNADPVRIQNAFFKGMVPYFATPGIHLPGNVDIKSPITGSNPNIVQVGVQGTLLKELIKKTESAFVHIHMVNPSKASFDDWNDSQLATAYKIKTGQTVRIIPNDKLDQKSDIKPKSKQNIQDANVLKLRFVYGYEPRIPLMKNVFSSLTSFFSSNRDAVNIRVLAAGRIPIVVDISAQMLSPPIEGGLPTNTVNRNGYIVGEDLIERLTGNQAMQWQVGQKPVDLLDGITDNAEQALISNFENDVTNFQGITDIGTQLVGGLSGNNSPTGHAGSSTDSILGDTNNLVSCSSGQTITNFY